LVATPCSEVCVCVCVCVIPQLVGLLDVCVCVEPPRRCLLKSFSFGNHDDKAGFYVCISMCVCVCVCVCTCLQGACAQAASTWKSAPQRLLSLWCCASYLCVYTEPNVDRERKTYPPTHIHKHIYTYTHTHTLLTLGRHLGLEGGGHAETSSEDDSGLHGLGRRVAVCVCVCVCLCR
jgi:hypothetical protein